VSSANRNIFEDDADVGRSLTNIKNNSGPRILPWGTPEITGSWSEMEPFMVTHCILEVR